MKQRLLALAVSSVALGLGVAGPAMADVPVQAVEQIAGNEQSAESSAESTQVNPTNQNISVRVLSPGDNGSVTQTNSSSAESFAGNSNDTTQGVGQTQAGGGGTGIQEAGQLAGNEQWADSEAKSVQVKPTNQNISVRVLSPGDDGDVKQTNESEAKSVAFNKNELDQAVEQVQGRKCCAPAPHPRMYDASKDADGHDDCGCSGVGIQAAGQEAYSKQGAWSSAESKQIKPENKNLSVRVKSPGDDGDVKQENESEAFSKALNSNDTTQAIRQYQIDGRCECRHGVGIQAAGQKAVNWQGAESSAESTQIKPENKSLSLRFKSEGGGGDLYQANSSFAGSFAGNRNDLTQYVRQSQGS